ncbi:hypothetical protein [Terrarubrum flagellatum]|uniref:hypothetical protein n=1 Tax=Terrirubrum flagellatum TaxID=2895980 RepID=UPI00314549FC
MSLTAADIQELLDIRGNIVRLRAMIGLLRLGLMLKAYNPNQPRVPAGNGDISGEWTRADSGWTRVAGSTRESGRGGANGGARFQGGGPTQFPGATVRQGAELDSATIAARMAITKVQERDPTWNPRPQIYETIEGAIRARNAEAEEARLRYLDLLFDAVKPRPGAEGTPAESPGRPSAATQREINRLGDKNGCSTCGTSTPGTKTGSWVGDHQAPNALNPPGRNQSFFPHCLACSRSQGGIVGSILRLIGGK